MGIYVKKDEIEEVFVYFKDPASKMTVELMGIIKEYDDLVEAIKVGVKWFSIITENHKLLKSAYYMASHEFRTIK